jgi:hypothetical protein
MPFVGRDSFAGPAGAQAEQINGTIASTALCN